MGNVRIIKKVEARRIGERAAGSVRLAARQLEPAHGNGPDQVDLELAGVMLSQSLRVLLEAGAVDVRAVCDNLGRSVGVARGAGAGGKAGL